MYVAAAVAALLDLLDPEKDGQIFMDRMCLGSYTQFGSHKLVEI
jgi:hypothetical protein